MDSSKKTSKDLNTLSELVQVLDEVDRKNYTSILKSLQLPSAEFEKFASWSDTCYTRNCIAENEKFELILICWQEGQETSIHDHGGEECWVNIIEGDFIEHIYKKNDEGKLELVKTSKSKKGGVTYMVDFMGYHSLKNTSQARSMSLHLYAKPIRNCNVYDSENNSFSRKELSYDNVEKNKVLNKINKENICLN